MNVVPSVLLDLLYLLLLILVSPYLIYRRFRTGRYRNGWSDKLFGQLPIRRQSTAYRIWLHAVSVGEVLQLRSVIDSLRQQRPDLDFIVTTTTETGFSVAREKFPGCDVAYYPLDFSWSVKNALQRVRPDMIVLVELELWPNFIRAAHQRRVPVALINGRLSHRSYSGYRWLRPVIQQLLHKLNSVAVQSEEYRSRFLSLGCPAEKLSVTGSIKFDCARMSPDNEKVTEFRRFFRIDDDQPVWIAGSTQSPEEEIVLEAYSRIIESIPECRLILAPRHPERGDQISGMIQERGFGVIQRSTGKSSMVHQSKASVGLLDTVGELGDCWGTGDVAFVGGSFGNRGGQNMIEPAALGVPVCFGPNTKNFRDAVGLLTHSNAARTVATQKELEDFVVEQLTDRVNAAAMGQRGQNIVQRQQGATARTCEILMTVLNTQQHESMANVA